MADSVQLFIVGIQGKKTVLMLPKNCTIDDLFKEVCAKCAVGISAQELRLVYGGTELEQNTGKRLSDYDIPNMAQIFMVIRLRGGPDLLPIPSFRASGSAYHTQEPDMISLDDSCFSVRWKMPCGHSIGSDSLTSWCRSILNDSGHQFLCPICRQEWSYSLIRQVASLTESDLEYFDVQITTNRLQSAPGFQRCPGCMVWCYREVTNTAINERAQCPVCTVARCGVAYHFCWQCLQDWKGPIDGMYCGNGACILGSDPRIQYLASRPSKTIGKVPGCPTVRGCPKCGILLEHTEACKHMDCKSCKHKFCFVCLQSPNAQGQWPCGSHQDVCTIAPCQTTLPICQ